MTTNKGMTVERLIFITVYGMPTTLLYNKETGNNLCGQNRSELLRPKLLLYKRHYYSPERKVVHKMNKERPMIVQPPYLDWRIRIKNRYSRLSRMLLHRVYRANTTFDVA